MWNAPPHEQLDGKPPFGIGSDVSLLGVTIAAPDDPLEVEVIAGGIVVPAVGI